MHLLCNYFFMGAFIMLLKSPITFIIPLIIIVRYGIPVPFGPLTPTLWYGPWPRPLVRGRALGPLSHGPRPRAAMLDLRHIGPVNLV